MVCQPKFKNWVDKCAAGIGALLWPPTCVLCGGHGQAPALDLCVDCAADLPRNGSACVMCAQPLVTAANSALFCGQCLRRPRRFHSAFCAFHYGYPVDHLVRGLKYHRALTHGRVLGELLAHELERQQQEIPPVIVPVPLAPQRLRERGYNQAVEIARPLRHRLGVEMLLDCVQRARATAEQTGLDQKARRKNVRGAFVVTNEHLLPTSVAIVDDVMTTGSTVNELARVLRRAGVQRVAVWAVARAS